MTKYLKKGHAQVYLQLKIFLNILQKKDSPRFLNKVTKTDLQQKNCRKISIETIRSKEKFINILYP